MEQHDPGGTSHAPDASGPKNDVHVRWKHPFNLTLGFAYQPTPIIANGRVYAVGRELLCVDIESGEVVFWVNREYSGPPTVAPARAYQAPTLAFATSGGVDGLHAGGGLSLAGRRIGLMRWQTGRETNSMSLLGGGAPQSVPVAANGAVFVGSPRGLLAIDSSSGRIQWRGDVSARRPAIHDGTVYVAGYAEGLVGYDTETGERTFNVSTDAFRSLSVTATPNRLIAGTENGLAGVRYDGTVEWQFGPEEEDLSRDNGAVAVANGIAFAGFRSDDGERLVAVDATDGTELWRSDLAPESSPQFAPPSIADDVVYAPMEDGVGGLAALDAADGHRRWQFNPGNVAMPWSPVAVVGETAYAVGNGHLYALEEA